MTQVVVLEMERTGSARRLGMSELLSSSIEDYLEAILALTENGEPVRVTDVAKRLGIAKPSVTEAVATLRNRGLVTQERYGRISLTPEGLMQSARIRRRHAVLRTFLTDVLGVDGDQAEIDACRIEHVVSTETMDKMVAFLEQNQAEST
ncbi:MAG: metal-dependent transcriptional regulator [Bacillota bacterium]